MDVAWPKVLSYVRDEREKCRKFRTAFACGWTEIRGEDFRYMTRRSPAVKTLRVVGTPRSGGREDVVVGRNFRLKALQIWGCDEEWVEQGIDDETRELTILRLGLRDEIGRSSEISSLNARGVRVLDLQNVAMGQRLLNILSEMSELEFVRLHATRCMQDLHASGRNFRFSSEKIWMFEFTPSAELSVESAAVQLASRKFLHGFARPEKVEELHVPYMMQEDMDMLRFPRLRSLVVLNWQPEDEAERIAEFFHLSINSLTSLVLHIRREALISLDFVLWGFSKFSATKFHEKLENFEISVVMAENADLRTPEITPDWASYFRCKFKHNLYFRRHAFGLQMRTLLPPSAASEIAGYQTPIDLFASEMFPGHCVSAGDGERELVHQAWMQLHEQRRLDYIDIFDAILSYPFNQCLLDDTKLRKITPRN